jgi:AcrR family transcriptional regulator
MARTVKPEEREARINEILDAAQTLIYTKGYDQMTINDLLEALQISKGAFYHYFDSKQALLEALVSRMADHLLAVLRPIMADERLSALERLEIISTTAAGWKTERVDLLVALMRIWYADDNVLVREKLMQATGTWFQPMLQAIAEEGIAEGAMDTPYPEMAGALMMDLMTGMSVMVVRILLQWDELADGPQCVARIIAAYTDAIERVLGVAPGALHLVDPAIFDTWGTAISEHEARTNNHRAAIEGYAATRRTVQGERV